MGWKILLWAAVVVVALLFLYAVRAILFPFVLALVISVLLDPSIRRLRLRGYSRPSAVLLVFLAFFLSIGALGLYTVPIVSRQVADLRTSLQKVTQELAAETPASSVFMRWNRAVQPGANGPTAQIDRLLQQNRGLLTRFGLPTTRRAIVEQFFEPRRKDVGKSVEAFLNGFFVFISSFASQLLFLFITPVLVFLILLDLERFKVRSASWIPPSIRAETVAMFRDIGQVFMKYLRGVTITVLAYMACAALILSIMGVPYAILLGVLFGVLYLIPYLGQALNFTTLFLVIALNGIKHNWLFGFPNPWAFAMVVTLIYAVLSVIFDQLVYPNLVGRSVGLHPVVSIFVIFSGGALFGLPGMILAFPLAGSVKVILERLLRVTGRANEDGLGLPATPLRHRTAAEV